MLISGLLDPLPWSTRLQIAVGAAKGLVFLHEAEKPVIYRDFKASNILLDEVSVRFQVLRPVEHKKKRLSNHGELIEFG